MTTDPRVIECAKALGCTDTESCDSRSGDGKPENCAFCQEKVRAVILKWLESEPSQGMIESVSRDGGRKRLRGMSAYKSACAQAAKELSE